MTVTMTYEKKKKKTNKIQRKINLIRVHQTTKKVPKKKRNMIITIILIIQEVSLALITCIINHNQCHIVLCVVNVHKINGCKLVMGSV